MKKLIIRNWMLSYDYKVFGVKFKGLRVVNTLIVLFVLAGLYNLLTPGFDVLQGIAFLPFVAVAIYTERYSLSADDLQYLDWEQDLQMMNKPYVVKANWDFDFPEHNRKELEKEYAIKYLGHDKFVEAWRFFWAFLWIAIACIVFAIWGFSEAGFPELRGF